MRPLSSAPGGGLLAVLLACAVAPGCNRDASSVVAVRGKATIDGTPLRTGTVSFRPDAARGNASVQEPAGEIDEQGYYELYTAGKKGAPPGRYKVLVISRESLDPKDPFSPRTKSHIPTRYETVEKSGLTVEVVRDAGPDAYDLKLTSP